ncbi:uncharacterized protein LOC134193631 [Corticium candelabrum]|uniref:uncharacterized protein LOC134193631 n=1 Tax=Corticium candelabrum TaxID=121492 RepID=UPI002E2651A0|nr:uncharacterized protein LOC134193631 [Corticium candelabrum]
MQGFILVTFCLVLLSPRALSSTPDPHRAMELLTFDLYLKFTDQEDVPELNGTNGYKQLLHEVFTGITNLTAVAQIEKRVVLFQMFLMDHQDHDLHVHLIVATNSSDSWTLTTAHFVNKLVTIMRSVALIVRVDQYPTSGPDVLVGTTMSGTASVSSTASASVAGLSVSSDGVRLVTSFRVSDSTTTSTTAVTDGYDYKLSGAKDNSAGLSLLGCLVVLSVWNCVR